MGQDYMRDIASPEIMSSLAMQGMEGSGALPESLAKAGAQYGLQYLQALPAVTQAQSQMVNLSDMPRQLREQDYLRRQGVVTTGLTGLPYTPTINKEGDENSLPLFHMFGSG